MRPAPLLALCALLPSLAGAVLACGGPVFTSVSSDASGASSGGGGTPDAAPGASGTFCSVEAGTHTFCDDFDGPALATKWDSIDQGSGGTAVTDLTTSDSPPGSLKSVAPVSVGTMTRGRVVKSFGTAARVVVSFVISLDATPAKLGAGIVGGDNIVLVSVGASYSLGINAHTDEVGYFENATGDAGVNQVLSSKDLVATSTLAGWTPVVLAIDLAHASLTITIGGVQRLVGAPITPPSGQSITVDLGAFSRNQTTPLAAHYDNVTIDLTP